LGSVIPSDLVIAQAQRIAHVSQRNESSVTSDFNSSLHLNRYTADVHGAGTNSHANDSGTKSNSYSSSRIIPSYDSYVRQGFGYGTNRQHGVAVGDISGYIQLDFVFTSIHYVRANGYFHLGGEGRVILVKASGYNFYIVIQKRTIYVYLHDA